jgi:hypothetical protein
MVPPQLWILGERIRQECLQKSYQAGDIISCWGQQPLPFLGWFNGFGWRAEVKNPGVTHKTCHWYELLRVENPP